ncbi:MAG: transmembrane cytochrome oxidase [Burkholderiales bacterium 66-5]|nr:MAG: transmembrane cytochrome oxidase [Burkholderiales bacterium 66-5]
MYFRWRFAIVALAALLCMVVTASLGRWQLSRAAQKQALHAAMLSHAGLPPLMPLQFLGALRGLHAITPELAYRRVQLRGEWMPDATVYLDNRQIRGRPGFYVFTPLRLSGTQAIVAVQRGWIARDRDVRTRLAPVQTPAGEVAVDGYLAGEPGRLFEFSGGAPGQGASDIRQNLTIAAYASDYSLDLLPLTVVQTDAASDGLQRDWAAPDSGVAMHYGYAFQWFGFSALVLVLYVWFQIIRPFSRRRAGVAR